MHFRRPQVVLGLLVLTALLGLGAGPAVGSKPPHAKPPHAKPPHVEHVFIVVLENKGFSTTFGGDSPAPYLSKTLRDRGEFLPRYYGIAHPSLGNYIALISGQAPNPQTLNSCVYFNDFRTAYPVEDGQYTGSGCVYPNEVETVAGQLEDAGLRWREYAQGYDVGLLAGPDVTCHHPEIGSLDPNLSAHVGDQYATRHNPFVYFHSIIDSATCASSVVGLSALGEDLRRKVDTPAYSFITPDLCDSGHDEPCVDGRPGGLAGADRFLRHLVPGILKSPGYRDHGLLVVTFDEAGADASRCCNQPTGPNIPGAPDESSGGGGRTGAVLLSPCIKPGSVDRHPYNHYSLLRSVEDNFGLPHLGYAGQPGLKPLGFSALNRPSCGDHRQGGPREG